jgi:hypothetical protein
MVDAVDLSEGWYVHLSVSDDEGGALLAAAAGIVDERGASLVGSPDSDLKELLLFSREDEAERARDAVIDVYQRLRRVAGLDAEPARVVALARPSGKGKSRHRLDVMLMREAKRVLNSESHFEWVVVLAQTACEVYLRDILDRRAAELGDAPIGLVAPLQDRTSIMKRFAAPSTSSRVMRRRRRRSGGATIRPTCSAVTGSCTTALASRARTPSPRSRRRRP